MELKNYIEEGIKKTGSVKILAEQLGMLPQQITNAKAHRVGISDEAIFKLADIIKANPSDIIIAKQMALAKTDEKKKFWEGYLNKAKVIGVTICVATVTNFVTPTPARAINSTTCVKTTQEIQIIRNIRCVSRERLAGLQLHKAPASVSGVKVFSNAGLPPARGTRQSSFGLCRKPGIALPDSL